MSHDIWFPTYDTTWKYGILKDIHKLGLRGRLPTFIGNFLANRTMQVRIGSPLSIMTTSKVYLKRVVCLQHFLVSKLMIFWNVQVILLIAHYMLMTSVSVIAQKAWGRLNVNCNKIWIRLKIGQQAMALGFPNLKHGVCISLSCASILHLYGSLIPVVEESKFLGMILIENLVSYPILNISKLNV